MSIKSEGRMQDIPTTTVKPLGIMDSEVRVGQNRGTMMNVNLRRDTLLDHVSDVSNSDMMNNRLSQNGIGLDDDIHNLIDAPEGKDETEQSLDQIVELHARKKNDMTKSQLVRAQSTHADTGKTVLWCLMEIECKKGLVVALDDDFTENYDEFALGLVAKEFSMV